MIVEAWGHRPVGARDYDLPHLLEWAADRPPGGKALCGAELLPLKLERHGMAREVGIPLCRRCTANLEGRLRPIPQAVVQLDARRRTRRPR